MSGAPKLLPAGMTLLGGAAASGVMALVKPVVGHYLGDPTCGAAEAAGGLANGLAGVAASFGVNWASKPDDPQPSAELALALRKALDGGLKQIEPQAPDPHGWIPLWRERFDDSPEADLGALTGEFNAHLWARHRQDAGDVIDAFWPLVEQTLTILAWRSEKHNPLNLRQMHPDLSKYLRWKLPDALREQWEEEVADRQKATNKLLIQRTGRIEDGQKRLEGKVDLLVKDLTSQHAADAVREKRLADLQTQALLDQLDRKDTELRQVIADRDRAVAEREAAQAELQAVIEDRAKIAGEVAAANPELAEQVKQFHLQMQELTGAGNEEMIAAYQRYADGDTAGALPVIKELLEARDRAVDLAAKAFANREKAKGHRPYAALVLEAKDRGEQTTTQAIEAWEKLQKLDPSYHWGWVQLGRLHLEAGSLADAQQAAERALETSSSDRERSVALHERGVAAIASGNLGDAKQEFEQYMEIAEGLAERNLGSAEAQRDLSVSYEKLGNVAVQAGNLEEARRRYEQLLEIAQRLAARNPGSAEAQRDLSVSYEKLGNVAVQAGDLEEARRRYEQSLEIREGLAAPNPGSAEAQRDLIVSCWKLATVTGDVSWWRRALGIAEKLDAEGRLAPADAWMLPTLRAKAGQ